MHRNLQFNTMFKQLGSDVNGESDIAVAMARVVSLIIMFSTKVIPCADYDINSEVQDSYDEEAAQDIVEHLALNMHDGAKSIHIESDEKLDEYLETLMKVNDKENKQKFDRGIGDHLMEQMQKDFVFSTTYLRSKDKEKNTGVIEIVYVHCPAHDAEINEVEPMTIDGFSVEVKLPYNGETIGIENKICSPASVKYLHRQWLRKMPLHARTVVSIIERANNMSLPASNQGIEGITNGEKNKTRDIKLNTSEPATYFWYRYLSLHRGCKMMIAQMDRCEGYVGKRRDRKNRIDASRNDVDGDEDIEDITGDAREIREENNRDMIFERKGNKKAWEDDEDVVRCSMISVFWSKKIHTKSLATRWKDVAQHAGRDEKGKWLIMSAPTFSKWIERKPTRRLAVDAIDRLKAYIRANGGII